MKRRLVLFALIALSISCKKGNQGTDLKKSIVGAWELEQYSCGACMIPVRKYPPDNGNIIVLSADGSFRRRSHDTLVLQGTYVVETSKVCNTGSGDPAIFINEGVVATPQFIQLQGQKLILSTPYCYADGATSTYRRIVSLLY